MTESLCVELGLLSWSGSSGSGSLVWGVGFGIVVVVCPAVQLGDLVHSAVLFGYVSFSVPGCSRFLAPLLLVEAAESVPGCCMLQGFPGSYSTFLRGVRGCAWIVCPAGCYVSSFVCLSDFVGLVSFAFPFFRSLLVGLYFSLLTLGGGRCLVSDETCLGGEAISIVECFVFILSLFSVRLHLFLQLS